MSSVHQEAKPTYVLIVRSPCSHTRNHHHPRQHDHGTPRSINLTVSQFQRVTFVRAKGTLEGQVMADSPMGWVRSTTLSKEEETEAHWTCCNPDKFAELALMLFTSLIHLLPVERTTSVEIEGLKCIAIWNTQLKLLVFLFPSKRGGVGVKNVVNFLSETLQSSCFWLSPLKGLFQVRWFDCSDF